MKYSIRLNPRALKILRDVTKLGRVEYERDSDFEEWATKLHYSPGQLYDTLRTELYGIVGIIETAELEGTQIVSMGRGPRKSDHDALLKYNRRKGSEIKHRGNEVRYTPTSKIVETRSRKFTRYKGIFIPEENISAVKRALVTTKFKKDISEEALDVLQYIVDINGRLKERWPRYTPKFHPTGVAKDIFKKTRKEDVTEEERRTATEKLKALTGLLAEVREENRYIHISRWFLPTSNVVYANDVLHQQIAISGCAQQEDW